MNELEKQNFFKLTNFPDYVTGEFRARNAKYADPINLCFKLLVDFSHPTGLFSKSDHTDTALNYLSRIGDTVRHAMLVRFIDVFQIFVSQYDFLIEEIEGLDLIQNNPTGHTFLENDSKIALTVRETSDMMIQSLITQYRMIFYDDVRGVEVLPTNLKKFNFSVLVYNAGYFNMLFYDKTQNAENDIINMVYPTIRKLSDSEFSPKTMEEFNNVLYKVGSASFNIEETGKNFAGTISNLTDGSYLKNNLVFNFRFASYSGRFNNSMGEVDYVGLLATMAAQNRLGNAYNDKEIVTVKGIKQSLGDYIKNTKNDVIAESKNIKKVVKDFNFKEAKDVAGNKLLNNIYGKLTSKNSPVGNLLSNLNVEKAKLLIKNTFDLGIDFVEDKFINNPIAKLNNAIFSNFSNDLYGIYKNTFEEKNKNISLIETKVEASENTKPVYIADKLGSVESGVKFGVSNVFTRKGF